MVFFSDACTCMHSNGQNLCCWMMLHCTAQNGEPHLLWYIIVRQKKIRLQQEPLWRQHSGLIGTENKLAAVPLLVVSTSKAALQHVHSWHMEGHILRFPRLTTPLLSRFRKFQPYNSQFSQTYHVVRWLCHIKSWCRRNLNSLGLWSQLEQNCSHHPLWTCIFCLKFICSAVKWYNFSLVAW